MDILNFVIAIVALIIAIMAFQRTGGTIRDVRKSTAGLLAKMEKKVREEEAAKEEKEKAQQ